MKYVECKKYNFNFIFHDHTKDNLVVFLKHMLCSLMKILLPA